MLIKSATISKSFPGVSLLVWWTMWLLWIDESEKRCFVDSTEMYRWFDRSVACFFDLSVSLIACWNLIKILLIYFFMFQWNGCAYKGRKSGSVRQQRNSESTWPVVSECNQREEHRRREKQSLLMRLIALLHFVLIAIGVLRMYARCDRRRCYHCAPIGFGVNPSFLWGYKWRKIN